MHRDEASEKIYDALKSIRRLMKKADVADVLGRCRTGYCGNWVQDLARPLAEVVDQLSLISAQFNDVQLLLEEFFARHEPEPARRPILGEEPEPSGKHLIEYQERWRPRTRF